MDKIDFIQGISSETKDLIREQIIDIKNKYGVEIKVLEVTLDLLYIQTSIGWLNRDDLEHKPLVFNLARQPFNIPEIKKQYKMSIVLGNS